MQCVMNIEGKYLYRIERTAERFNRDMLTVHEHRDPIDSGLGCDRTADPDADHPIVRDARDGSVKDKPGALD